MERINQITKMFGKPISVRQGTQGEFYLSAENKYRNDAIHLIALTLKERLGIVYLDLTSDHVLVVFDK